MVIPPLQMAVADSFVVYAVAASYPATTDCNASCMYEGSGARFMIRSSPDANSRRGKSTNINWPIDRLPGRLTPGGVSLRTPESLLDTLQHMSTV